MADTSRRGSDWGNRGREPFNITTNLGVCIGYLSRVTSHKTYIYIVITPGLILTETANTIEFNITTASSGGPSWAVLINYFTALEWVLM